MNMTASPLPNFPKNSKHVQQQISVHTLDILSTGLLNIHLVLHLPVVSQVALQSQMVFMQEHFQA